MLLAIFFIGHLLGDFFFQSSDMAEKKNNNNRIMLLHSLIYFMVFVIISFIFVIPVFAFWSSLIIAGTHLLIDFARAKFDNKFQKASLIFKSFIVDQILHIIVMIAVYYLLDIENKTTVLYNYCSSFPNLNNIVLYTLLFAILLSPSAVFVKKLFAYLFKDYKEDKNGNVGNIIGKVERMIIAILLIYDQFAVIGLVLTAKSIARFKQLEKKDFAEKYLVGTLISVVIALITTLAIKSFI